MPHKEEYSEFTPDQYPPFPEGFETVELQTISLKKLLDRDHAEQDHVFEACKDRGFFYLELPGCAPGDTIKSGADEICRVAERTFQLPEDEKMKYVPGQKQLFGYVFLSRRNVRALIDP